MDVRLEPEIAEAGNQTVTIYGYATQFNAEEYVESNSYPIKWDSNKERYVVNIPPRVRIN